MAQFGGLAECIDGDRDIPIDGRAWDLGKKWRKIYFFAPQKKFCVEHFGQSPLDKGVVQGWSSSEAGEHWLVGKRMLAERQIRPSRQLSFTDMLNPRMPPPKVITPLLPRTQKWVGNGPPSSNSWDKKTSFSSIKLLGFVHIGILIFFTSQLSIDPSWTNHGGFRKISSYQVVQTLKRTASQPETPCEMQQSICERKIGNLY